MKLKVETTTGTSADLCLDDGGDHTITIHCADIWDDTAKVARAVNLFDALVSALMPFRSSEMGSMLVGIIDTREVNGAQAQKNLARLINMIDVILDKAEEDELDDTNAG